MIAISVLVADDDTIVREGLRMILDAQEGIEVVGEARDGREALQLVEQLRPDVAVMDIAMPIMNGPAAIWQIAARFPNTRVVILTMHEDEQYLAEIASSGAIGCVLKRSAGTELVTAIRAPALGESYFSPSLTTRLLHGYRQCLASEGLSQMATLTEREREVLQCIAEGLTNQQIADRLVLSIHTVASHRKHIMEKLDARDRTALVKWAIRIGLVSSH